MENKTSNLINTIRLTLLRLVIALWMIPLIWCCLPVFWLFSGDWEKEVRDVKRLTKLLWQGLPKNRA